MKFVKMHGIGNDYVYIDACTSPGVEKRFAGRKGADLIRRLSDRHRGIGSDGVILVCRPSGARTGPASADVRMRMFNADGSESEMCGNGVRCVAKFAHDRLGIRASPMRVQTGRGVLSIDYDVSGEKLVSATVDMGRPILEARQIPVLLKPEGSAEAPVVDFLIEDLASWFPLDPEWDAAGVEPRITCVSMGNPHVVLFCKDPARVPLARVGPIIERHALFPRRVNVHFVHVSATRSRAVMRTWERGAGETLACGTGACAVLVAGVLTSRMRPNARSVVHLPGGDLRIRWDSKKSGHVFMTGPAEDVFEGEWPEGSKK